MMCFRVGWEYIPTRWPVEPPDITNTQVQIISLAPHWQPTGGTFDTAPSTYPW